MSTKNIFSGKKKWLLIILVVIVISCVGFAVSSKYFPQRFTDNAIKNAHNSAIGDSLQYRYRYGFLQARPGEVVIGFKQTLSIEDIEKFVKKNNLQMVPVSNKVTLFSMDHTNDEEQRLQKSVETLKQRKIIDSCQISRRDYGGYVAECMPNIKIPVKELDTRAYRDLNIFPHGDQLATIVVEVPIGQENALVEKLLKQPEVFGASAPK